LKFRYSLGIFGIGKEGWEEGERKSQAGGVREEKNNGTENTSGRDVEEEGGRN